MQGGSGMAGGGMRIAVAGSDCLPSAAARTAAAVLHASRGQLCKHHLQVQQLHGQELAYQGLCYPLLFPSPNPMQANFEHGFGVVDSGGFVKCDLSADGTIMAGCTAKGHLILWDIGQELRKAPNGQMLYQWLASMPVFSAKKMYTQLLDNFPLLYNAQDSRGWTVLMHAAANCSPEIVKVIVGECVGKEEEGEGGEKKEGRERRVARSGVARGGNGEEQGVG